MQGDSEIVTVYLGADAPRDASERLAAAISAAHPDIEVEILEGGQPYYLYIAAIE